MAHFVAFTYIFEGKYKMKILSRFTKLQVVISIITVVAILSTTTVLAYFQFAGDKKSDIKAEAKVLPAFGVLDASVNPTGKWGTSGNPYLIHNEDHLMNLYTLQNSKRLEDINENYFFQVSDEYGKPCFVGGSSSNNLFEMQSIGSEDFPFISTLRGVKATSQADYITLPGGEISDTSVIGNIRVTALPGQIDIGLFGNIGKPDPNDPNGTKESIVTTGGISDLLLSNIQISTQETGGSKADHPDYFASANPHESNHIGILAGHAQYCRISNVSVYYSKDSASATPKATVEAFNVGANTTGTRYTTAGGIIGFYKQIIVGGGTDEYPVTSNGSNKTGGTNAGFGLGIVYSEDIWTFMEKNYFGGGTASADEYGIQDTFDEKLYGIGNTAEEYFQIGVFTFAHSNQMLSKDRIAKLWKTASSNEWSVSTSNNYSSNALDLGIPSKQYKCTQIQYSATPAQSHITSQTVYYSTTIDLPATGTPTTSNRSMNVVTSFPLNTNNPDYRYMIVVESGGSQYALVKYGATASAQKIDTNNFIIPEDQLNYYTFRVLTRRAANTTYPPYTTQAGYRYWSPCNLVIDSAYQMQFLCYGDTYPSTSAMPVLPYTSAPTAAMYNTARSVNSADTAIKKEAERPLRIYDTVSFMATSVAGSPEGVLLTRSGTGTGTAFRLQRTLGSNSTNANYLRFTEGEGFVNSTNTTNATNVKLYAVRITNNTSTPSESPVSKLYEKQINTPASGIKTYDISKNVLFYTGNASSSTPSQKYTYDMRTIESLSWMDNSGRKITRADTTLKMADPTSYYYLNNVFWGVKQGIKAPAGLAPPFNVVDVPLASIGFTVQGHGIRGGADQTSKVFVIVATDPSQLVDQTMTLSYFPYTTTPTNPNAGANPTSFTYSGTRLTVGSFALPPIPGSTASTTTPIYVKDGGSTYTAYPNLNTLLVAYELQVPVSRYARTYYLEASKGSANFVYLSAERTASDDNNPTHSNDIKFNSLTSIDYVCLRNSTVATVGSADYIQSMTLPYFGLTRNPANPDGNNASLDILKVLQAKDLKYNIFRSYDTGQTLHTIHINVNLPASPSTITSAQLRTIMQNMNFNFSEWSYVDTENYRVLYSDAVKTTINNLAVDWTAIEDLYP